MKNFYNLGAREDTNQLEQTDTKLKSLNIRHNKMKYSTIKVPPTKVHIWCTD